MVDILLILGLVGGFFAALAMLYPFVYLAMILWDRYVEERTRKETHARIAARFSR